MLSTMTRAANRREPRNHLQDGVTRHYQYRSHRRRGAPDDAPLPDIPASAADFATQTLNFPADAKQQEALTAPNHRMIICCTRQWGKSTVGAIKALHHALTNPDSLTLLASRTRRQAGGLLAKVIAFARFMNLRIRRAPGYPDSLLLPNGARIVALPGSTDSLRGFSAVSLIVLDEAAYVPDELYHALRPMLATTDGGVWLMSTPRARSGFFYDIWSAKGGSWTKFMVTAAECPRISQRFLDDERHYYGPALFNREYFCDFSYSGQCYFDLTSLDAAAETARYESAEHFSYGRPPLRYYLGFDVGQRSSHSALIVLELITGTTSAYNPVNFERVRQTHLFFRRIQRFPLNVPYDSQIAELNRIVRDLGDPRDITLLLDATGCGQPFLETLRKQKMGVKILPVAITSSGLGSIAHGVERVSKTALMACAGQVLMSKCLAVEPGLAGFKELREEMEAFRVKASPSGAETFRSSQHDDLLMAFALAAWNARCHLPKPTEAR